MMLAAGLPNVDAEHAQHAIECCFELIEAFKQSVDYKLSIRIGINSGECVAGITGKKKVMQNDFNILASI